MTPVALFAALFLLSHPVASQDAPATSSERKQVIRREARKPEVVVMSPAGVLKSEASEKLPSLDTSFSEWKRLVKQHQALHGAAGDALRRAKAEIVSQIQSQNTNNANAERSKRNYENTKKDKERELNSASKWYKFWYWSIWSKKQKNIKKEIDYYNSMITKLNKHIQDRAAETTRLEAARDAKHEAAGVADDLEKTIASLTSQISEKEDMKVKLKTTMEELTAQRTKAEADRTQQIATNAALLLTMTNSGAAAINKIDADIQSLKRERQDAQDDLDGLKQQHGV